MKITNFIKRISKKAGSAPGTLIHVGEERTGSIQVELFDYDQADLREEKISEIELVFPLRDSPSTTWINVNGIHDLTFIERLGRHYHIHPLTLEDIVNTEQRPKSEEYEEYVFIVMKMLSYDAQEDGIKSEQVSFILDDQYLISFQEDGGDVFDSVRERIRKGGNRIRKAGCDYLCYALMDAIVDQYFLILEKAAEKIGDLEETILENPTSETLQEIHGMKREMIYLRKQVWPLREVLNTLSKTESPFIEASTRVYIRDVHDHSVQIIDTIESFTDVLSSTLDLYLSTASVKMNEVMKVLTIIATIFIPLTFVVGVYGMNFKFMPELDWRYGYFAVWGVMLLIALAMVAYFKKKGWW